jgi:hypothetical protein
VTLEHPLSVLTTKVKRTLRAPCRASKRLVFQTVVASQEEARPAELGNGHRKKHTAKPQDYRYDQLETKRSPGGTENQQGVDAWVTSTQATQPGSLLLHRGSHPFPGGPLHNAYGMATVLPYVGPVKGSSLYIVAQAINGRDAGFDRDSLQAALAWTRRRLELGLE